MAEGTPLKPIILLCFGGKELGEKTKAGQKKRVPSVLHCGHFGSANTALEANAHGV